MFPLVIYWMICLFLKKHTHIRDFFWLYTFGSPGSTSFCSMDNLVEQSTWSHFSFYAEYIHFRCHASTLTCLKQIVLCNKLVKKSLQSGEGTCGTLGFTALFRWTPGQLHVPYSWPKRIKEVGSPLLFWKGLRILLGSLNYEFCLKEFEILTRTQNFTMIKPSKKVSYKLHQVDWYFSRLWSWYIHLHLLGPSLRQFLHFCLVPFQFCSLIK